jgi:hypothetical protein
MYVLKNFLLNIYSYQIDEKFFLNRILLNNTITYLFIQIIYLFDSNISFYPFDIT